MKNSDKKREVDSSLLATDFSEIEQRIAAWDGWHEGPIDLGGFVTAGSSTGRFSSSSGLEPQYLASAPKVGVAIDAIVNPNEET